MVQSGVYLVVGSVDRVEVTPRGGGGRLMDEAGEWAEQACPQLDEQNAEFQSEGSLHELPRIRSITLADCAEGNLVLPKELDLLTRVGDGLRHRHDGEETS